MLSSGIPCLIAAIWTSQVCSCLVHFSTHFDRQQYPLVDWIRIATEIELNYTFFDAFVVLHGTDTMAYTASALSFLLEDLGKTVVRR